MERSMRNMLEEQAARQREEQRALDAVGDFIEALSSVTLTRFMLGCHRK